MFQQDSQEKELSGIYGGLEWISPFHIIFVGICSPIKQEVDLLFSSY
jgi:hypothetical protein